VSVRVKDSFLVAQSSLTVDNQMPALGVVPKASARAAGRKRKADEEAPAAEEGADSTDGAMSSRTLAADAAAGTTPTGDDEDGEDADEEDGEDADEEETNGDERRVTVDIINSCRCNGDLGSSTRAGRCCCCNADGTGRACAEKRSRKEEEKTVVINVHTDMHVLVITYRYSEYDTHRY